MRAAFDQIVEDEFGAAALQQALRDKDAETHVVRRRRRGSTDRARRDAPRRCGGNPGPSSTTSTVTVALSQWVVTLTSSRANCTAFWIRLLSPCMISGLRRTSGSSAAGAPVVAKISRTRGSSVRRARRLDQRRDRQPRIGRGAALVVGLMRQLREDVAAPLGLAQQQLGVLAHAANRAAGRATSSLATTAIVASGLPSSCAAAAASAPTAETRCSRARASWVAATASRSRRASARRSRCSR